MRNLLILICGAVPLLLLSCSGKDGDTGSEDSGAEQDSADAGDSGDSDPGDTGVEE